MSDLDSSGLFPLLPVEVRLLIWESAFVPQILTFEIEAYRKDEDPTAVPYYVIHNRQPDPNAERLRSWVSGRCVPVHVPPQATYKMCQEARHLAFALGYQTLRLEKRGGLARRFIWNPGKDFISLPQSMYYNDVHRSPRIPQYIWPKVFAAQYGEVASLVQNIALPTSLWYRVPVENSWLNRSLSKYASLQQFVLIVDEDFERERVKSLISLNYAEPQWGSWALPHDAVQAFDKYHNDHPDIPCPDVRVVADVSKASHFSELVHNPRMQSLQLSGYGVRS
jgi:hypothetical protein